MKLSPAILLSCGALVANAAPVTNNATISNITTSQPLDKRSPNSNCAQVLAKIDRSKRPSPFPGSPAAFAAIFPERQWLDWRCAFENHLPVMPHDNQTPEESQKIKTAIQVAHAQTGVDPRLLMAIIMQESHGELRVHTTIAPDGSKSGGLMQCAGCPSAEGIIKDGYIPQDLVNQMVIGGAIHYKGNLDRAANRNVFEAFRLYNSGSANLNDLNDGMAATGPYVWEVANRLHGWRN